MATVCLTMIVKNEAHVMERCIQSVAPLIDTYLIADTGSTDGTQEKITETMASLGKLGAVVDHAWEDFGTNRTKVFEAARSVDPQADYALVIDADDTLEFDDLDLVKRSLGAFDAYDFNITYSGHQYKRPHLFRQSLPWYYKGTIHEYADCKAPFTRSLLKGVTYVCLGGGGRHTDPKRSEKEIALLFKQLDQNPNCPRASFYLAQTYFELSNRSKALYWNEKVLHLPGWSEERFMSAMRLGDIYSRQEKDGDWVLAQEYYLRAMGINPRRAEPHERLARLHRNRAAEGWPHLSYLFAKAGSQIRPDPYGFLVDSECHESRIWDELSLGAFYSGRVKEAVEACKKVLNSPLSSPESLTRAEKNMDLMLALEGI